MIIAEADNQQVSQAANRGDLIRRLNDNLRRTGEGGRVVLTVGVTSLPATAVGDIVASVAKFDLFNADNDPYGEHDCATLEVGEHRVIWKIDYYDRALMFGSEDPANALVTTRVLTIMLADEY